MSSHGSLYNTFWGKMDEWTASRPLTRDEIRDQRQKRNGQESSFLGLSNAEANYNYLLANPQFITIDKRKAREIFFLFRGERPDLNLMTDGAKAFLQGALMAAVDGSFAMSFVKILFDNAYMMLPSKDIEYFISIVRSICKDAFKHLFRHWRAIEAGETPPLYKIVVGAISYDCSAYFVSIAQGAL